MGLQLGQKIRWGNSSSNGKMSKQTWQVDVNSKFSLQHAFNSVSSRVQHSLLYALNQDAKFKKARKWVYIAIAALLLVFVGGSVTALVNLPRSLIPGYFRMDGAKERLPALCGRNTSGGEHWEDRLEPLEILESCLGFEGDAMDGTQGNLNDKGTGLLEGAVIGLFDEGRHILKDMAVETNQVKLQRRRREQCAQNLCHESVEVELPVKELCLLCGVGVGSALRVKTSLNVNNIMNPSVSFFFDIKSLEMNGEQPSRQLRFNFTVTTGKIHNMTVAQEMFLSGNLSESWICSGLPSPQDDRKVNDLPMCEVLAFETNRGSVTSFSRFTPRHTFDFLLQIVPEGLHVFVGKEHLSSVPLKNNTIFEDAVSLAVSGGGARVELISTSIVPLVDKLNNSVELRAIGLKAVPLKPDPFPVFIGVVSSPRSFAQRMSLRRTWFQYPDVKEGEAIPRFFLALDREKHVNLEVFLEAERYGDIIIYPYIDSNESISLKTIAVAEYGYSRTKAEYILRTSDDTFMRVDAVVQAIKEYGNAAEASGESLYWGHILKGTLTPRSGEFAIPEQEYPESSLPDYAASTGYAFSRDIAGFLVEKKKKRDFRLVRVEDINFGVWMVEYMKSREVKMVSDMQVLIVKNCEPEFMMLYRQDSSIMDCHWAHRPECCPT